MTERLKRFRRLLLPLAGFGAFIWFLVRVIPKPSRARYPCMQAAAPLASSFVIWLLSLGGAALFATKARSFLWQSRWRVGLACAVGACASIALNLAIPRNSATAQGLALPESVIYTDSTNPDLAQIRAPNQPLGVARGVKPGRVVWVHDPDATRDDMTNNPMRPWWFEKEMTNQETVDTMLKDAILALAGESDLKKAWERILSNFNESQGRGAQGYRPGEKIAIKINMNGYFNGPYNINTSPQVCIALLDQLVNTVGVAQEDISIGDPNFSFDKNMYGTLIDTFPNASYWGRARGWTPVKGTSKPALFGSDGKKKDKLPRDYVEATYLINIPVLKKHHRAGISLGAKNHFGAICPFNSNGAAGWHPSLPVPNGGAMNTNGDYGQYRALVDFMGHKDIGGKTVIVLVDALWSSINWGHPAIRWQMAPFNGDWPSSLLVSMDQVAIESVGFDLLVTEFTREHPSEGRRDPRDDHGPFPQYRGVDDYLRQAADPSLWPAGLVYDPENDGTPLKSLGVHEHWNNAVDRQYSRNLGTGKGIELVYRGPAAAAATPASDNASVDAVSAASEDHEDAAATQAEAASPADLAKMGQVYGEFEDAQLFASALKKKPAMKSWSDEKLFDALSGATIQVKTLGPGTARGEIWQGSTRIAVADGWGQFWFALEPGTWKLVARCEGYEDQPFEIRLEAGSSQYRNVYLDRKN